MFGSQTAYVACCPRQLTHRARVIMQKCPYLPPEEGKQHFAAGKPSESGGQTREQAKRQGKLQPQVRCSIDVFVWARASTLKQMQTQTFVPTYLRHVRPSMPACNTHSNKLLLRLSVECVCM